MPKKPGNDVAKDLQADKTKSKKRGFANNPALARELGKMSSRKGIANKMTEAFAGTVYEICEKRGMPGGPPEFFTRIMMGEHPFGVEHPFLAKILAFDEKYGEQLPEDCRDEWKDLMLAAHKELKDKPISVDQAITAGKTISEYVYPKRAAITVDAEVKSTTPTIHLYRGGPPPEGGPPPIEHEVIPAIEQDE